MRASAVVAAVALAALIVLPAPSAAAHPTLQVTTPPAGYAVMDPPREILLDFGEPVGLVSDALRLTSGDGRPIPLAPAALTENARRLVAGIGEELTAGAYRVAWQVRGQDGDLVSGVFSFAVGAPVLEGAGLPASGVGGKSVWSLPAAALRWGLFAAIAAGLGGVVGTGLAGRIRREAARDGAALAPVPPPVAAAAATGGAATVGLIALGGYGFAELIETRPGLLLGIELVAFVVAVLVAAVARIAGRPGLGPAAAAPILAVVAAEALRAHPAELSPLAGVALTAVHLLAAAVWIGGLLQVLNAAARWRGQAGWTRLLLFDYARVAVWSAVVVIATGMVQGVLLVPTVAELFGTEYGRVLLAKLAVVVVVIIGAFAGRRRLRRPLRSGGGPARRPVGRAVRVEIAALAGVLALTGVLTSLTPPAQAAAGMALPPPPVGPALPLATLAGQVTVSATASTGRLVVRLTTPLDGPYDDPPQSPPYRLSVRVTPPGDDLALVSCGTGCFTAPVAWRAGTTTLALDVTAVGWAGGAVTLDVPWPPQPAAERLDRVLAAMRAVGPFILREASTSDYRGDPGPAQELPMTGADFVAREPYAEGAADAVAVPAAAGDRLAFAFPANGIVVHLWLDGDDRITRSQLVSPNHLITRTFDYPRPS